MPNLPEDEVWEDEGDPNSSIVSTSACLARWRWTRHHPAPAAPRAVY